MKICLWFFDYIDNAQYKFRENVYYSYFLPKLFIKIVGTFYRIKDERLSHLIHNFAGEYQRRPQEGWSPPEDWECWIEEEITHKMGSSR